MKKTYKVWIGENVVFVSAETIDLALQYAREQYPNEEVTFISLEKGTII